MINRIPSGSVQHRRPGNAKLGNFIRFSPHSSTITAKGTCANARTTFTLRILFPWKSIGYCCSRLDAVPFRRIEPREEQEHDRSLGSLSIISGLSIISSFADFDRSAITEKRKGQRQFFSLSASVIVLIRSVIHDRSLRRSPVQSYHL